jgi:hypothetical protein
MAGLLQAFGSITNLFGGQQTPQGGVTPEEAMYAQYLAQQDKIGKLFPMSQTNTGLSTASTARAGAAGLGGAINLANISNQNAAMQFALNAAQQNAAQYNQGAQSVTGQQTSGTAGNQGAGQAGNQGTTSTDTSTA